MDEDAVEPQQNEVVDSVEQNVVADVDAEQQVYEKTMVPLSALQKERQKKREIELELQWERQIGRAHV